LTRAPLDPESFEVAEAACNLVFASYKLIKANNLGPEIADFKEAEMLARKSVQIIRELLGFGDESALWSFGILINLLSLKVNFDEGMKILLENYLFDAIRYQGIDPESAGHANFHLGHFHHNLSLINESSKEQLELSKSYYKVASRLFEKHYNIYNPKRLEAAGKLSLLSNELQHTGIIEH
jgi:hypothetical protein